MMRDVPTRAPLEPTHCPTSVEAWCCGEAQGRCEVSFQRLTGSPECYDDCRVTVTGYLVVRPNVSFRLFDHPFEGNSGGWILGIALDRETVSDPAQIAALDVKHDRPPVVEVRGRYHADLQRPDSQTNGYISVETISPVFSLDDNP